MMKVLVATTVTQGSVDGDYFAALEGELVMFPMLDCDCPDCGCRRGMGGLSSRRTTTSFEVVERPELGSDTLFELALDSVVAGGWGSPDDPELVAIVRDEVAELCHLAACFPVGTVLGRRGDQVYLRAAAA
jgi:hypothetical protein